MGTPPTVTNELVTGRAIGTDVRREDPITGLGTLDVVATGLATTRLAGCRGAAFGVSLGVSSPL